MLENSRIFVAGHAGLVGSAICRRLRAAGFVNLILRTRAELDLQDQLATEKFFEMERPDYVFMAAARVGGILANSTAPADFIFDNLIVQTNVIHSAWRHGTKKLLFLGSSCIYPKHAPQPMREEYLLSGPLEPTNEWYAVAKIAGIKLAQAYRKQHGFDAISAMPTNLYGEGDNFDLQTSHVLPAMLRKFTEARANKAPEVVVWGTGTPRREFLHVDDLASACLFLMQHYDEPEIINVGTGIDVTIRALAGMVQKVTGYEGQVIFDATKPDGTPRKLLDVSKITSLGWKPAISLEEGIASTWRWYVSQSEDVRKDSSDSARTSGA
jgi:GDP-L-fucose synthase